MVLWISRHRRPVRQAAFLVACAVLLATPLRAQKIEKGVTPVEVSAKPAVVLPGSPVTLSGLTALDGKHAAVSLSVKPPSGPAVALTATAAKDGSYSAVFKNTNTPGAYTVKAVSPDGKGSASASFTVAGAAACLERSARTVDALMADARDGAQTADQLVATLPASPARDEARAKLNTLQAKLQEGSAQAAKARQGMEKLASIAQRYPETTPGLRPLVDPLNEWDGRAEAEDRRIRDQLARSRQKGVVCDEIDAASEALNALSVALNFIGEAWKIALHFSQDKVVPDALFGLLPVSGRNPNAKFAIAESLKAGEALLSGPAGWVGFAFGLAVDTAGFVTSQVFDKYCEKFQGPVDATFHAEFTDQGRTFWKYDVKLQGRIVLRFAKGAKGSAAHLTGQIEGTATNFTLWENFIALEPKLKANVLFHRALPPPGFPYIPQAGSIPGALVPTSFYMRVEGQYAGDTVTLNVGEAVMDYPPVAKGQVVYVFVDYVTLIPEVIKVSTPYQGAQYIFSRGMRKDATFEVKSGKAPWAFWAADTPPTLERTFTRKEQDTAKGYLVTWQVHVKACNPECP